MNSFENRQLSHLLFFVKLNYKIDEQLAKLSEIDKKAHERAENVDKWHDAYATLRQIVRKAEDDTELDLNELSEQLFPISITSGSSTWKILCCKRRF